MACIMRILLRYVVEVEATDTSNFGASQLNCFVQTIDVSTCYLLFSLRSNELRRYSCRTGQAVVNKLIPSVQRVTTEFLFADDSALLSNSPSVRELFRLIVSIVILCYPSFYRHCCCR